MRLIGQRLYFLLVILLLTAVFSSCSRQNYPINRPFVYENKIELNGNFTKDEKKRLTTDLVNYWDDSLQSRKVQQFFLFERLKNPPVFDSANVSRSMNYMNAYLNSQGYYYATFDDSVRIDTVKDQMRTHITMQIEAGKNITIDSISYNLGDTTLQQLTRTEESKTQLKKGDPYTKQAISTELDRLVGLYRKNGYFNFTRDDIFAEVDSTDARLIELTLDPFKQAQLIAEADKRRKENPTWDIDIRKRPEADSSVLRQYHIGHVYFYPETRISDLYDSVIAAKGFLEFTRRDATMRYKKGTFKFRPLREHTNNLRNGNLYNEDEYLKSVSSLGQIGAWQQVDGKLIPRDKDSLDIYFFLVPAIKQSFTVDLETSLNRGDVLSVNTWGISTNFSYFNRNVWKQAIQSVTNLRTGVELGIFSQNNDRLVQTFLASIGHTYAFPRLIQPFKNWRALSRLDNKRTLFSVNTSYVDRRDYYNLRSLVTNWGYEWKVKRGQGDNIWLYRPLNVELYGIERFAKLDELIKNNPFLKASFNEGNVVSQTLSLLRTVTNPNNPNKSHYMRLGAEEAGGLFGLIPSLRNNIYRYLKFEAEYRQSTKFPKAELAYRAQFGIGYNYGTDSTIGKTLPFFKQFIAGGPYSMRAWGVRQLGLGSSTNSEQDTSSNYRDRFGDMQLEANIEYRFPITTFFGFKVSSAVFADVGNIWNVKPNPADPEASFSFSKLGRDLALGIGTGLRIDFSYLLLRLDLAYKVKDPARQQNSGWMSFRNFEWTDTRPNGIKISNFGLQLGIGLPF